MAGDSILPSPAVISPTLDIGRAYKASEAAAILGITTYVLNERVREGWVKPLFETGDRRYSGYALAQLLGWPLDDNLRLELPRCSFGENRRILPSYAAGSGGLSRHFPAVVGRVQVNHLRASPADSPRVYLN